MGVNGDRVNSRQMPNCLSISQQTYHETRALLPPRNTRQSRFVIRTRRSQIQREFFLSRAASLIHIIAEICNRLRRIVSQQSQISARSNEDAQASSAWAVFLVACTSSGIVVRFSAFGDVAPGGSIVGGSWSGVEGDFSDTHHHYRDRNYLDRRPLILAFFSSRVNRGQHMMSTARPA